MESTVFGTVLCIANPVSGSGKGAQAAEAAAAFFGEHTQLHDGFELIYTKAKADATAIAMAAGHYDTVITVGGDGIIHEAVNGLMQIPAEQRPRLGIVPVGSGNDFARTLSVAINKPAKALSQLAGGHEELIEVGMVNGEYFMETLSFGLDAAIALDTQDRRDKGSSQQGEALYVTSGYKILARAKGGYGSRVVFDDDEPLHLSTLVFAVQVGPSYGGGYKICPAANPKDGKLDVCYNVSKPALPWLLALFTLARWGRHASSKVVKLRQLQKAVIDFEREPPCQIDGERLTGTHYEISVVPGALRVLTPGI